MDSDGLHSWFSSWERQPIDRSGVQPKLVTHGYLPLNNAARAREGRAAAFLIAAVLAWAQPGEADSQSGALSGDLSELSDEEVGRRYDFIRQRLDEGQRRSQIWQYGFTSGWGLGVVIGATQASLATDKIARTAGIVTSVKAAGGVARLIWSPNPGRHGAADIQMLPTTTPNQRLERLSAAEALLSDVEDRALDRLNWKRHASNVAINLLGGGIVLGVGGIDRAWDDALVSFGVGVVAGEAMSFTMPWRGVKDAADYRKRFLAGPYEPEVSWRIAPMTNGLSLHVSF